LSARISQEGKHWQSQWHPNSKTRSKLKHAIANPFDVANAQFDRADRAMIASDHRGIILRAEPRPIRPSQSD
jgi:hypothetical protein